MTQFFNYDNLSLSSIHNQQIPIITTIIQELNNCRLNKEEDIDYCNGSYLAQNKLFDDSIKFSEVDENYDGSKEILAKIFRFINKDGKTYYLMCVAISNIYDGDDWLHLILVEPFKYTSTNYFPINVEEKYKPVFFNYDDYDFNKVQEAQKVELNLLTKNLKLSLLPGCDFDNYDMINGFFWDCDNRSDNKFTDNLTIEYVDSYSNGYDNPTYYVFNAKFKHDNSSFMFICIGTYFEADSTEWETILIVDSKDYSIFGYKPYSL